jgi:hypothetical protein
MKKHVPRPLGKKTPFRPRRLPPELMKKRMAERRRKYEKQMKQSNLIKAAKIKAQRDLEETKGKQMAEQIIDSKPNVTLSVPTLDNVKEIVEEALDKRGLVIKEEVATEEKMSIVERIGVCFLGVFVLAAVFLAGSLVYKINFAEISPSEYWLVKDKYSKGDSKTKAYIEKCMEDEVISEYEYTMIKSYFDSQDVEDKEEIVKAIQVNKDKLAKEMDAFNGSSD